MYDPVADLIPIIGFGPAKATSWTWRTDNLFWFRTWITKKDIVYDLNDFTGGSIETHGLLFDNATVDHVLVYTTHFQPLQIFFPDNAIYSGFQE